MLITAALVFSIHPYIGAGDGGLDWNIASGLSASSSPNVLSELQFEGVTTYSGGVRARVSIENIFPRLDFFLEGDGNYQRVDKGEGIDTDYSGDNRTDPYSQSVSEIVGDDLRNLSGGVGARFYVGKIEGQVESRHFFSLIGGGVHKEQNLNFQNGMQTIYDDDFFTGVTIDDLNASLANLDSDYITEWQAFWFAGQYEVRLARYHFYGRMQWFNGTYYGEGRWNLRANLRQPKSFTHHADADGRRYELGMHYFFNDGLSLSLSWQQEDWQTDAGIDSTFLTDDTVQRTRFNRANWRASEWRLGFGVHF